MTLEDALELGNRWTLLERAARAHAPTATFTARISTDAKAYWDWLQAQRQSFTSHMLSEAGQVSMKAWGYRYEEAAQSATANGVPGVPAPMVMSSTFAESAADAAGGLGMGLGLGLAALAFVFLSRGSK